MLATFLFTMACTLVLAAVLVYLRYRIETLQDERMRLGERVHVVPAAREPEMAP
jgi:hypothetical protein